ncbi:unnamed protein product [Victoria cruziana]
MRDKKESYGREGREGRGERERKGERKKREKKEEKKKERRRKKKEKEEREEEEEEGERERGVQEHPGQGRAPERGACRNTQVKAEHQRPGRLLSPWELPEWKWDEVTMDFVMGLPRTRRQHDAIWVIVDRLSKSAHFLAVRANMPLEGLAELYIREIVRLHGVPKAIVSDRDPRFTSRFSKAFQNALGTKLKMSSAFYPQTDGQSERMILTIEDMLRACILKWQGEWDRHLPSVEFAYNNSYHASIEMAPFEALYGRPCRAPGYWSDIADARFENPLILQHYADQISPTKGIFRFGKKGKLSPRFIGPFEVIEKIGSCAYRLALPPHLSQVHDIFHIFMLRKYLPDPNRQVEYADIQVDERLNVPEEPVRIIDEQVKRLRNK